jgi:hypothetical protein
VEAPAYLLTVVGQSSCAPLLQHPFVFPMSAPVDVAGAHVYHLIDTSEWRSPAGVSTFPAMSLSLVITPESVTGSLAGEARVGAGNDIYGTWGTIDGARSTATGGRWTGSFVTHTYGLSTSYECPGVDHQWSLTPK